MTKNMLNSRKYEPSVSLHYKLMNVNNPLKVKVVFNRGCLIEPLLKLSKNPYSNYFFGLTNLEEFINLRA